jgi:hypothetical protein
MGNIGKPIKEINAPKEVPVPVPLPPLPAPSKEPVPA